MIRLKNIPNGVLYPPKYRPTDGWIVPPPIPLEGRDLEEWRRTASELMYEAMMANISRDILSFDTGVIENQNSFGRQIYLQAYEERLPRWMTPFDLLPLDRPPWRMMATITLEN